MGGKAERTVSAGGDRRWRVRRFLLIFLIAALIFLNFLHFFWRNHRSPTGGGKVVQEVVRNLSHGLHSASDEAARIEHVGEARNRVGLRVGEEEGGKSMLKWFRRPYLLLNQGNGSVKEQGHMKAQGGPGSEGEGGGEPGGEEGGKLRDIGGTEGGENGMTVDGNRGEGSGAREDENRQTDMVAVEELEGEGKEGRLAWDEEDEVVWQGDGFIAENVSLGAEAMSTTGGETEERGSMESSVIERSEVELQKNDSAENEIHRVEDAQESEDTSGLEGAGEKESENKSEVEESNRKERSFGSVVQDEGEEKNTNGSQVERMEDKAKGEADVEKESEIKVKGEGEGKQENENNPEVEEPSQSETKMASLVQNIGEKKSGNTMRYKKEKKKKKPGLTKEEKARRAENLKKHHLRRKELMKRRQFWRDLGAKKLADGPLFDENWGSEQVKHVNKWKSPYTREQIISIANEPKCKGILDTQLLEQNDSYPIRRVADLTRPGLRSLIVMPRFGLGNTLRGYVSAYVYALLTGRRLVRFHGSSHAIVFDSLCEAFHCGFDVIHWEHYGTPGVAQIALNRLKPVRFHTRQTSAQMHESLEWKSRIVVTNAAHTYDGYWQQDPQLRECVLAAFNCSGLWCIYSRAMHSLLEGGPTKALAEAVQENMAKHVPAEVAPLPQKAAQVGLDLVPDIAIHLRTRTQRLEVDKCRSMECKAAKQEMIKSVDSRYTDDTLWRCITKLIRRNKRFLPLARRRKLKPKGLTIFLATDNEALRPIFASKLQKLGQVYYSAGKVVHTSKSNPSTSGLPTMAEFYLMSRAHILMEAEDYVSTFAYFAGLAGNGTMVAVVRRNGTCRDRMDHLGRLALA